MSRPTFKRADVRQIEVCKSCETNEILNDPPSVSVIRSRYQIVASTSRLWGGASFHPRSSLRDGRSTLKEKRCSRSDASLPGQAP